LNPCAGFGPNLILKDLLTSQPKFGLAELMTEV